MKNKGSILMISLWILSILVMVAVGLGHRAALNLRLARYQRDRLKANFLIQAGINKAILLINEPILRTYDTVKECGIKLKEGESLEDLFSQSWNNAAENFKIGYLDLKREFHYGLKDEERYININGMPNINNKLLLWKMFEFKGLKTDAEGLSNTIIDWIDQDTIAAAGGPEDEIFKNERLKSPQELVAILEYFYEQKGQTEFRQKAQDVFREIKDLLTVSSNGNININTVSFDCLKVLGLLAVANLEGHNISEADVDELVDIIRAFREEDGFFDSTELNTDAIRKKLNLEEEEEEDKKMIEIINELVETKALFIAKSENFSIETTGTVSKTSRKTICIYNQPENKIVLWREN